MTRNNEAEKAVQRSEFLKDVSQVERECPNVYGARAYELVRDNSDQLIELYTEWNKALLVAAKELRLGSKTPTDVPRGLEALTVGNISERRASGKVILGFAGPGASGKGTVSGLLEAPRVLATTTRARRANEIDGVHYHFVDEQEFGRLNKDHALLAPNLKPGRGWYGIQVVDLKESLEKHPLSLIEESPANLIEVGKHIASVDPEAAYHLIYILPPGPVLPTLAVRLATRSAESGVEFSADIQSTLGLRQVQEFRSVVDAARQGVKVMFVVNDDLTRAVSVIRQRI